MPRGLRSPSDLGWKVVSLLLAYLFWLAVVDERQAIGQLDVPVRFDNLDRGLALVHDRPSSVTVRVQGGEPLIKTLEPLDVEARVDLGGYGVGTHWVRLGPDSRALSSKRPGIRILEVFPPALEIRLEPKLTADVAVKVVTIGAPARGWEVAEARSEPRRVRIEGPESAVQATLEARTREVLVEGRSQSFQLETWVDVANPDVRILSEPRANVIVNLREVLAEKSFVEIPIAKVGGEWETRLRPELTRITVGGPETILAELTREDVVAYVDISGLEPRSEDYNLPLKVTFNRDLMRARLEVKKVSAESVAVRVLARKPRAQASNGT